MIPEIRRQMNGANSVISNRDQQKQRQNKAEKKLTTYNKKTKIKFLFLSVGKYLKKKITQAILYKKILNDHGS